MHLAQNLDHSQLGLCYDVLVVDQDQFNTLSVVGFPRWFRGYLISYDCSRWIKEYAFLVNSLHVGMHNINYATNEKPRPPKSPLGNRLTDAVMFLYFANDLGK